MKGKVNCQELVFVFLLTFSSPPINSSLLTASHEINGVRKEKERLTTAWTSHEIFHQASQSIGSEPLTVNSLTA